MIDKSLDADLLTALKWGKAELKEGPLLGGICSIPGLYNEFCEEGIKIVSTWCAEERLHELFKGWEKFSGSWCYPIPGKSGAQEAYWEAVRTETLWDENSEYGQLRRALLDFCITSLEEGLKNG